MRKLVKTLLFLLLSLPLLLLIAWLYLQAQIKQLGITHWSVDISQLSLHQATLRNVQVRQVQADTQLDVSATDLHIAWSWPAFFQPKLETVHLASAEVQLQLLASSAPAPAASAADIVLTPDWTPPAWLPQAVHIERLAISLPCAVSTQCHYIANVSLTQLAKTAPNTTEAQWQLKWKLSSPEQQLSLHSEWLYQQQPGQKSLQATLQLDQHFALSLQQRLDQQRQAQTQIALAISPPSAEFLALLASWQLELPEAWLAQFKQPVQLFATANWQLPHSLQQYEQTLNNAHLTLFARAPDPFILPGIGWIKGEVQTELTIAKQQLEHWQLAAELELSHYAPATLQPLFSTPLAPLQIRLQSSGSDGQFTDGLNLSLQAKTAAPLQTELQSQLNLTWQNGLAIKVQPTSLTMQSENISLPALDLTLEDLNLALKLTGHWQPEGWQLSFNQTVNEQNRLSATLKHPLAKANLDLQLADTYLSQSAQGNVRLHSKPRLTLKALQHAELVTQNWQLNLELTGELPQLVANGQLTNDSSLTLQQQLQFTSGQHLRLNWQLDDMFLLAGNPLKNTLRNWPELLDLSRGRIGGSGSLQLDLVTPNTPIQAQNQLQLRDVSGLYDRTLFSGLTSQLTLAITPAENGQAQLAMTLPDLRLQQLNHGIEMGPLRLTADYAASASSPLAGIVKIHAANMQFLNGELSMQPLELDLSNTTHQLEIQIQQLDLTELLRQHPTTDLYAQGKMSGRIPLVIHNNQFSVAQGMLAVEQPGGQIQYRSPARAAGNSNAGMKLVFDALDDFHFNVLTSEVSYSTDGKLLLALQLQGFNPAVQQGRAINLTINLEEDLPAMITSLQLTNKLNDTITKRVQQYIQRQQAAKSAAGETP